MRANLEIKAHCADLPRARERARELATEWVGVDRQVDTYFRTRAGRLKLRESSLSGGQLVPYLRPDEPEARRSDYQVIPVADPTGLKALLSQLLGVHRVVAKEREIALVGNVRIHLDRVDGLGSFLELEAVFDGSSEQEERERVKLSGLMARLGVSREDLIAGSYEGMLGPRSGAPARGSGEYHGRGGGAMRPEKPRIPPLSDEELDPELRERFGDGPMLNIFRTLAHHPKLMTRWLVFGHHVLAKSTLPPRDREIAILRVGWLCRSEYEWGQHVLIGRSAGLSDEDVERITEGAEAPGWSDAERALLRATDELHDDACVADATWASLCQHYDTRQRMDLVFAVGQYHLVSMALNTFGVQRDEGVPGFPA